jgi:hypothetical protein
LHWDIKKLPLLNQTKRGYINTLNINENLRRTFVAANVQVPSPIKYDLALPLPKYPKADFGPAVKPEKPKIELVIQDSTTFLGPIEPTLLVYQTHKWTAEIEEYFLQLYENAVKNNMDVVIIAVTEKNDLKISVAGVEVLSPNIEEIYSMYPDFHTKGLWACNHWLLMWVWKYYAKQKGYTRLWSYEYDVRSKGNLGAIWSLDNSFDYISSKSIHRRNGKDTSFWGPIASGFIPNWTALKQVFRVSDTFLDYLHSQFLLGHSGQDEMTLASHAKEPKGQKEFKISSLENFLSRHWSPNTNPALLKDWAYYKSLKDPPLKLFHPIK